MITTTSCLLTTQGNLPVIRTRAISNQTFYSTSFLHYSLVFIQLCTNSTQHLNLVISARDVHVDSSVSYNQPTIPPDKVYLPFDHNYSTIRASRTFIHRIIFLFETCSKVRINHITAAMFRKFESAVQGRK